MILLAGLLRSYGDGEITISAVNDAPLCTGKICAISWQDSVLIFAAQGHPEFFQIGLNIALAPFQITEDAIAFSDGSEGEIVVRKALVIPAEV